jgi:restriction system protein
MIADNPYYKRLLQSVISKGKVPLYDSIQWILELLPEYPRDALNVISAFSSIHIGHLPDGRIHGLSDAESIIRARYFDAQVDTSVLYSLIPTEFEHVVEDLYYKMGYKTRMTKASYDGGRDVIASRTEAGKKEHIVISCKRVRETVEPVDYREIFAPIEDEKATKGVVVTTSDFSPEAYKLAKRNPRFELINQIELQKLLNEFLGADWSNHLSYSIQSSQDRHPRGSRA